MRSSALEKLGSWHLAHPHRWPLSVVMDIWDELHWRLLEELKETLRELKREVGRETMTLSELKFHALLPGPDGQAWLRLPSTFDIERPDGWFQREVVPRIDRKQERMLWNLTWAGNLKKDKPAPAGGAGGEDQVQGEKLSLKTLLGPKLTMEEVSRAKERAPLDRDGKLLCWGHLCHLGCATTNCQRSHAGLRGTFEALDPCVQMQLLRRGGLRRMKQETKESVVQKVKDLRAKLLKDKTEKIGEGRKKAGKTGEGSNEDNRKEDSHAGGQDLGEARTVRFWEVPEAFEVDYTKDEDLGKVVRGPQQGWADDVYKPERVHQGRDGTTAPREDLISRAQSLAEGPVLSKLKDASDDLYAWASTRVAQEPTISLASLLTDMSMYGMGELAREASEILESQEDLHAGSS